MTTAVAGGEDWEREAAKLDEALLTINQWREHKGLPPVAWGDSPWYPLSKGQWETSETTTLEGTIKLVRHDDGRVEILDAPPVIRVSLEFLCAADPVTVKVSGRSMTFGGQVVYEVTGWDAFSAAFMAKLVEDRRAARG